MNLVKPTLLSLLILLSACGNTDSKTKQNPPAQTTTNTAKTTTQTINKTAYQHRYPIFEDLLKNGCAEYNCPTLPQGTSFTKFDNTDGKIKLIFGDMASYVFDEQHHYEKDAERIFLVKDDKTDKMGYVDTQGQFVIPTNYDMVFPLSYDLFAFSGDDGKMGIIDRKLNTVIAPTYDNILDINFENERILAILNGNYGFLDFEGKNVIPFEFAKLNPFYDGLAGFLDCYDCDNPKVGYLDTTGKVVIPAQFPAIELASTNSTKHWTMPDFVNGMAQMTKTIDDEPYIGFIDTTGKLAIDYQYNTASDFADNGLAIVSLPAGEELTTPYIYINKTGEIVLDDDYEEAYGFGDGNVTGCSFVPVSPNEAIVRKDEVFYIIDDTGAIVKELQKDESNCPIA